MKLAAIACLTVFSSVPAISYAKKKPELTPMQIQGMQQKEFDASKPAVFSSVMDVFQDLGYSVGSADLNTGFITAESATGNKTGVIEAFAGVTSSGNTRATAFVEQMSSGMTRVRLNFVATKSSSFQYGQQSRQDKPILEPAVYQRAFEKVDEALFVRRATNSPTPDSKTVPVQ